MTRAIIPEGGELTRPGQVLRPAKVAAEWQRLDEPGTPQCYRCELRLVPETNGGYSTYVAQLCGVVSQGDSPESAIRNTLEALEACLRTYIDNDMPIPWAEPSKRADGEDSYWTEVNV